MILKTGVYFPRIEQQTERIECFWRRKLQRHPRCDAAWAWSQAIRISSPTVFVGFGTDWRTVMEAYGDANAAIVPKLPWNGGVAVRLEHWYAYGSGVSFLPTQSPLQVSSKIIYRRTISITLEWFYINLDSSWSNLTNNQLQQFTAFCHTNGQKSRI